MKRFIITISLTFLFVPTTFALRQQMGGPATAPTSSARKQSAPARVAVPATSARQQVASGEQSMLARVTVYWARGGRGSDRYTRQHKCATGARLRAGHCAVDPKRIPYGSQVIFPDGTCLAAVDTGTAVKNRKAARKSGRTVYERNAIVVDRFFETKGQALAWANRNPYFMTVRVVPPNYRRAPQPEQQMVIRKAVAVKNPSARPLVASNSTTAKNLLGKTSR